MRRLQSAGHVIDLLFPITLFFVFAASSLMTLIAAADLYQRGVEDARLSETKYGVSVYLTEKIRQNDDGGALSLIEVDGVPCLKLTVDYDGTACDTYIYEQNGTIKELFIVSGEKPELNAGQTIMQTNALSFEEIRPGLIRVSQTDEKGIPHSLILTERSGHE